MDFDGISPAAQAGLDARRGSPWGLPAWLWSLLAFLAGLLVTLWLADLQHRQLRAEQVADFERDADRAYSALVERLETGELVARSVQTVFLASRQVDPAEFEDIYANLQPRNLIPGLQAMAYAQRIATPGRDAYITVLVGPAAGNESLLGLDVARQPANLAALEASIRSDEPALSAPFRLVQSPADAHADGITMRLPIYTPGPPPRTLTERRERVVGSLALSFQLQRLLDAALSPELREGLHIRVADVTTPQPQLLFASHPRGEPPQVGPSLRRDLTYGGRVWRVEIHPVAPAQSGFNWDRSMLLSGLLVSLLLALLVRSVATTRARALELGREMSTRYRESEERFRALNELLPALVLLANGNDGRITYANQASRTRLGEKVSELHLPELFEDPELRQELAPPASPDFSNREAVLRSANGDHFWAALSISRVELNGRSMLLMVASDTSEQRQLTELLSYQATHDTLTELYNRREFERRVERALAAAADGAPPAALLYLDLDQFKLINDTSGHIAGDQLLTQLAIVMREQLREGDVLARLGGDEFGVLALNIQDQAGALQVAERLREGIDGYVFVWEQCTYTVSASIGAVMIDRGDLSLKDLLAHADTACYMAKDNGRNRVHFYFSKDDNTARRQGEMEWANRLRWAIDEGRLLLTYQEVWPLLGDTTRGPHLELLLRFRDENGKLVVPGAFMPAAERYGLMPMIDRWVVDTALANFDRLHPSGAQLQLATINLSGASIEDESLAELVLELLARHKVDPRRVCFEITETVAVRNLSQVIRFMERLRKVGCQFALDDFGAGMSSFGYLKNLPVDIVKIDGSFIRDMLSDPMSLAIVRAVTDIAHQRGLQVIAEWVSSAEISDALRELQVDYAQGYALHMPELVAFHRHTSP